jgi:putative transposase
LREFKKEYDVAVYAFCLMTNHVHLLLAPHEPTGIGKLMKRLAGRQTRHHNRLEGRSGTLWEGRYKSSLVQSEDYLLACCRYIELNPVRARMVAGPQDYTWSSCRYRLGLDMADWLDLDPCYLALGTSETERRHGYRRVSASSHSKRGVAANPRGRPARTTHRDGAIHGGSRGYSRPTRGTERAGETSEV